MRSEGPPLEVLLRRLLEIPSDFLAEPRIGGQGDIDVAAVVWDVLRQAGGRPPTDKELGSYRPWGLGARAKRNRLRLVLVSCWLLADPSFQRAELADLAHRFLQETLLKLDPYMPVDRLLHDSDRREELVRRLLSDLGLRPAGETEAQAADRLQTLDSGARVRVLRQSAKAERRAQEVREAMARKAALDAASRYGE